MLFPRFQRLCRRSPGFTAATIGVIATAVALAATAASFIDAVLFRALPAPQSDELYRIHSGLYDGVDTPPNVRDMLETMQPLPIFSYDFASNVEYQPAGGERTELVSLAEFQGDVFGVMGWQALHGRLLVPSDMERGAEAVAVISHRFWHRSFGASLTALDRTIELNGVLYRIVGVLPPAYDRINRLHTSDLWTAFVHTSESWKYDNRNSHDHTVVARISDPAALPALHTQLEHFRRQLRHDFPDLEFSGAYSIMTEQDASLAELGDLATKRRIISGLIVSLLVVACLNVGNLLLVNAHRRRQEFAFANPLKRPPDICYA
ncbi:MAG: ABC transporter permease [Candidatus Synoicihabitans palmerolidicus]|nr:ABC transporter permease [Candidatus Synoicihabitans palmerolidicus]